jgi:hypothetical protein
MRAVPIPDGVAEAMGGRRVVIGEPGDPTRDDVRPCEYVVTASALYPGRPVVSALVELDDDDRAAAAAGMPLWLTLDGGELPWSLTFVPPPEADE